MVKGLYICDMKNQYNKEGYEEGLWEDYHSNGEVNSRRRYSDGVLNGLFEKFHDNGQLSINGNFLDYKCVGIWFFYTPDGELRMKKYYYI
jgi:antitoxin component YwqK of YwqJK toxin-antitoxin module